MKCRYCGSNNPASGVTCVKCGRRIDENSSSPTSERPVKSEEKNLHQTVPVKKTAPLKASAADARQNGSGHNQSRPPSASSVNESPEKRKTTAWELYPRTGSYFVLDAAREAESSGKEEDQDSSGLLAGRYKIIRRLGSGGMSVVYLARDMKMETDVVIKEMSATSNMKDNSEYLKKRFDEEAKLLYRLHWSGIPKVTEYFSDNDSNYLVMEYVHGENLEKLVEARELPVITIYEFVDWMGQLLETLIYLHQCDPPVIHRDIKPSNIMLNDEGDVILVDFGLAKSLSYFTSPQTKVGTRGYASPEHYLGKTSKASDIYSLGASFHYLLTHEKPETRLPFEFPPISAYREDLGDDVDYIMEKMLEKSEKNRYASAAEVLEDLNLLSDILAESYKDEEFSSEEVETKKLKEPPATIVFRKPVKPASPPPPAKEKKAPPPPSQKPSEKEKTVKKPEEKKFELPKKETPDNNYGMSPRTRSRCSERKPERKNGLNGKPEPVKSSVSDKTPTPDAALKSAHDNMQSIVVERPKKNGESKGPKYSRNGHGSEIETPELSGTEYVDMPPLQKPQAKKSHRSNVDDEFAEESFMEKSGGFLKAFLMFIFILALGASAYFFGPSLITKYMPASPKAPIQEGPLAAEPSVMPSASPVVTPSRAVTGEERDNLAQGKRYLDEGKYDKAIMVFTVILAKDPNNTDALTGRGKAYLATKDLKSANDDFSRAISIDPKNGEVYLKRSEINFSKGAYKEAEKDLNWALSLKPDDPQALYLRGICCEKSGELDKSIADLSRIPGNLEKDKNEPLYKDTVEALGRVYLARGNSFVLAGKHESAISDFKESLKYKPDSQETYLFMAEAYLALDNINESIAMYEKVLKKEPDSSETKAQLARLHFMQGSYRQKDKKFTLAIQSFENSLRYDSDNSETKANLIKAYETIASGFITDKKYVKAIDCYNRILELAPDNEGAYFSRGLAYYRAGNKKLANKDFDKFVSFKPDRKFLEQIPKDMRKGKIGKPQIEAAEANAKFEEHLKNAEDALKKEDYSQTEEYANLALKINNKSGHAFYLKGVANLKMERSDVAEKCFLNVLKYEKEDTITKIQSGKFLSRIFADRAKTEIEKKNYKTADEYAVKAIDLDGNDAGAYLSRGIICMETNKKKDAIVFLEKAKEKSEGIDTPVYNIATELIEKAQKQ